MSMRDDTTPLIVISRLIRSVKENGNRRADFSTGQSHCPGRRSIRLLLGDDSPSYKWPFHRSRVVTGHRDLCV